MSREMIEPWWQYGVKLELVKAEEIRLFNR